MVELLEFIDELKELQTLYNSGDLRNFDFDRMVQKYEREVEQFEADMEEQASLFWKPEAFYSPVHEV